MITLTVTSYNGTPGDSSLSARFDELGGTIGRADTNQLVLPDPERGISRVHAQIVYRNGAYAIVDRGSNPILVNGRALGSGREMALADGDQVQIGGYQIAVKQATAAQARHVDDPFADLLGPSAKPAPGSITVRDPLSGFGPDHPTTPAIARMAPRPSASPPAAASVGIPDDWDPFAPVASPVASPAPGRAPAQASGGAGALGLDLGAAAAAPLIPDLHLPGPGASADSIDALFGLKAGGGADPFANSALDIPLAQPNMAAHADPLRSLGSAPLGSSASESDAISDLQRPFTAPPAARPAPAQVVGPAPTPTVAPAPKEVPTLTTMSGARLSWDSDGGDGRTVVRPTGGRTEAPAPYAPQPVPATESHVRQMAPPQSAQPAHPAAPARPVSAPSMAAATAAAPGAPPDALLAAFREGLGMPTLDVPALTPELMRLIGQLLGAAAGGTVDLLVARAALKREVRAEATMIVARENNPLKFSPTAEAALQHLLSPPTRGFMPAAPAMRDAYDDLRAHQFGFVAGMRAALEGVLERFDPAELEGRLTQRSVLQSILPGGRKARMWEVFVEHYAQIRSEAADDFHTLFGKAFLKAYEEHIAQLKGEHR